MSKGMFDFCIGRLGRTLFLVVLIGCCGRARAESAALPYPGVNLAGADFGEGNLPGTYGTHYIYPTVAELDYFKSKGMTIIRFPFRWERLQRTLNADFNATEWARFDSFVQAAVARDLVVILDPHNYARYHDKLIGSSDVPISAFADFWGRLAEIYQDEPKVWFGLMNEPRNMPTEDWLTIANAAIAAIRDAGANNRILVPGNAWTGAHSWNDNWYGTPNGTVMKNIVDPVDNYLIEVHQYIDGNSSGTGDDVAGASIGSTRLKNFTAWCRAQGVKAFLGEFGGPRSELGLVAIEDMVSYMEANADVWEGWTWWAAGPWWGDYMFALDPKNNVDRPQMAVLAAHCPIPVSVADNDADGLPDDWEQSNFGGLGVSKAGPDDDWDDDGLLNREEFLAGTNPKSGDSRLAVALVQSNGTLYVQYDTVVTDPTYYAGRTRYYDLYTSTGLTNQFTLVPGHRHIRGDGATHRSATEDSSPQQFYQLRTRLE